LRNDEICAVIPAAGRGSRLGIDCPKILAPIAEGYTVWSILRDSLMPHVGHIHVVVSPPAAHLMESATMAGPHDGRVSMSVQQEPRGMGDAIFGARNSWSQFRRILVVWGDQAGISGDTLRRAVASHALGSGPRCTLPVVEMERPYVQYVFADGGLEEIRQSREGVRVDDRGFSDAGIFLLETGGLAQAWRQYARIAPAGAITGEVNFLPFLVYLSRECAWQFGKVQVADPSEARGINTPEDLKFFQDRFADRLMTSR
jgi:bifunctional UDP-N-acetylglucosamine pyrophosphorylase/glucosamine-1-phosphate N-acetyltransferase